MKLSLVAVLAIALVAACAGSESDRTGFDDPKANGGPLPNGDGELGKPGTGGPDTPGGFDGTCAGAKLAKSYAGCDFRVAPSPVKGMILDKAPCYAVFLTNIGKTPAKITVALDGKNYDAKAFGRIVPATSGDPTSWSALDANGVAPGAMAVLFLSHEPGAQSMQFDPVTCPITPAVETAAGQPLITAGRRTTFHITTDQPVVAYDMMPFGGARSYAPSAQIVLPTTAWGTNYVASMPPSDPIKDSETSGQNQWLFVAAAEDDTKVEVGTRSVGLTSAGTQDEILPNMKATVALAKGEYVLWMAPKQGNTDASGTVFKSNKPIAVMTGDIWSGIASSTSERQQPMGNGQPLGAPVYCCMDATHQMLAPVSGFGRDYVAAPFPSRLENKQDESIRYRVVGIVEGTKLTFDPPIAGAPASVSFGTVADFETTKAFRVTSQDDAHPFMVSQAMTYASMKGGTKQDGTDGAFKVQMPLPLSLGDPELLSVQPSKQWLGEYTFLTDPTYATTSLVITRVKGDSGFSDVTLDCLGKVSGWQPVGKGDTYEWARVDLVRKNVAQGACGTSGHKAHSDGKFGIVVWGVDWWASYAYPAGGTIAKLNDVVVDPK